VKRNLSIPCSRREWLLFVAAAPGIGASELSGFYYRDYSKCLPDYLSTVARAAYQKRNHALSQLADPTAIRQRQAWVRETFWKLVGGQPEQTPLNARTIGRFERTGYAVEKVIYESRPGLVVSANLYIPKTGNPPYPGVLFQMGHSILGKAYAPYQKCCQGLAQLGFVVLAFDPMGQGERVAYLDESGTRTRLSSVDAEHTVPGKQLLLLGDSASRYQLWDAIRSLDYLASHPLVDRQRLASTGQSGGGTVTMLLACVDERLKAAAVSSGNTEDVAAKNFNPPGSTDDAEQDLVGSGSVGFDRWDLLYPIAPKPLLIQVSAHDFFGTYSPQYLDDGGEQYHKLAHAYEILGHPECLGWRSTPLPHGLTYELRVEIYNWFERWLKQSDRQITEEPPVSVEAENLLWTGATGNVTRDHQSLRPFDLVKQSAASVRRGSSMTSRDVLPFVQPPGDLQFRQLAVTRLDGARAAAIEVPSAPEVWIPAWLFIPEKPDARRPSVLVLDDRGRNVYAHEDDLYHRLAQSGRVVCAADIRGIGDTRPEVGRGNPQYTVPHDSEEEYAWAALILSDPLLAQRITDILCLARALKNNRAAANPSIALAARGRLTVPSLFAFNATGDIDSLYLAGGLVSFQNLLETESYSQTLANFAWNLFRVTDLPVLAQQSTPRPIHLAGPISAAGDNISATEARNAYSSENVTISDTAAWDYAAFEAL